MTSFFSAISPIQIAMVILGFAFAIFLLWYLWNSTLPRII